MTNPTLTSTSRPEMFRHMHCCIDHLTHRGFKRTSDLQHKAIAGSSSRSRVTFDSNALFGRGSYYFYDQDYHMYWRRGNSPAGGSLPRNQLCLSKWVAKLVRLARRWPGSCRKLTRGCTCHTIVTLWTLGVVSPSLPHRWN